MNFEQQLEQLEGQEVTVHVMCSGTAGRFNVVGKISHDKLTDNFSVLPDGNNQDLAIFSHDMVTDISGALIQIIIWPADEEDADTMIDTELKKLIDEAKKNLETYRVSIDTNTNRYWGSVDTTSNENYVQLNHAEDSKQNKYKQVRIRVDAILAWGITR